MAGASTATVTAANAQAAAGFIGHPAIVQIGLEVLAVVILAMIAGLSRRGAQISLSIVGILWVLWGINYADRGGTK